MTFQSFTGKDYLKIDIANNYGLDKQSWATRISWFDRHAGMLDELVLTAKEPALFYAGVKAYRDVAAGKPIGYMISLDGTSSGLQLLAALTCDPMAAALCNVVDTGDRQDAYQAIYNHMKTITGDVARIDPKEVKQAIMTAFYSSKAMPKRVFGEGKMLDVFYDTLAQLAPGAWDLNEAMLELWDPDTLAHSWVLPDNFHVHIKVMNQVKDRVHFLGQPYDVFYNVNMPTEEGRSLGANTIHSIDGMLVRELTRRCDYDVRQGVELYRLIEEGVTAGYLSQLVTVNDHMVQTLWDRYQESGYLSARILDYINGDNLGLTNPDEIKDLLDSLPCKPFKVVSIHDCFRVLPNYGDDLRRQYNLQLQLIAKSNLLQDLITQLVGKPVSIGKLDPTLPSRIAHTNYALS